MSEQVSEVWILVQERGHAGHGEYESFYSLISMEPYNQESYPSAFATKEAADTFIEANKLISAKAIKLPIATAQQANVAHKDTVPSTLALQRHVASLDPTKEVLCRIYAEDGGVLDSCYTFRPSNPQLTSSHVLMVYHPGLKTLNGLDDLQNKG